jgi:23S rRNA pseudouridine2457 synthase
MPLILFNKPFRVLSQFSAAGEKATLADFIAVPGVYPAGRLDFDSEGLMALCDDGRLQARISRGRQPVAKGYWVQVEGEAADSDLERLRGGVSLKDGPARAVYARRIEEPSGLWLRDPPIRYRQNSPTTWIDIGLDEGRNRQVRRMTAAVGLPTLRLIRHTIGPWSLGSLQPGESRRIDIERAWRELKAWQKSLRNRCEFPQSS